MRVSIIIAGDQALGAVGLLEVSQQLKTVLQKRAPEVEIPSGDLLKGTLTMSMSQAHHRDGWGLPALFRYSLLKASGEVLDGPYISLLYTDRENGFFVAIPHPEHAPHAKERYSSDPQMVAEELTSDILYDLLALPV